MMNESGFSRGADVYDPFAGIDTPSKDGPSKKLCMICMDRERGMFDLHVWTWRELRIHTLKHDLQCSGER